MLSILASGSLVADPKPRTTTAGKPYATGTMRVPAEDAEAMLVSIITFNVDAVQALLALTKGDALAIAGRAKLTSWTKDGEERHGLSVVVDQVMSVYQADKRRRKARNDDEQTAAGPGHPGGHDQRPHHLS